jgi:acyl carrier protein
MTRNQIQEKLAILLKPYNRSIDAGFAATDSASLANDLNINSVDLVDMVLEIEQEFDVLVPDSAIQEFETVGQVVDFLVRNVGELPTPEPVPTATVVATGN